MHRLLSFFFGPLVLAAFGSGPAIAQVTSIPIANHSFEADSLPEGANQNISVGWTSSVGGVSGVFNPEVGWIPNIDGQNAAFSNGGSIYQILSATLTEGVSYVLRVQIGDRSDEPFAGYAIELRAGSNFASSTLLARDTGSAQPPNGGWDEAYLRFSVTESHPQLGENLIIVLSAPGIQANFDSVRLGSEPGRDLYVLAIGILDGPGKMSGPDSAQKVADAFARNFTEATIEVASLDYYATPGSNDAFIRSRIASHENLVEEDDIFVFYIHTHGEPDIQTQVSGDESGVLIEDEEIVELIQQSTPSFDGVSFGDEYLKTDSAETQLTDDQLHDLFDTPKWSTVNKLFLIESCYSGGFWGSPNPPDPNETGDIASLPKSALIASAPEGEVSYGDPVFGIGFLAYALGGTTFGNGAIDEINGDLSLLPGAVNGYALTLNTYVTGISGGFVGTIRGLLDSLYGVSRPATYHPALEVTDDFVWLGEESPAAVPALSSARLVFLTGLISLIGLASVWARRGR